MDLPHVPHDWLKEDPSLPTFPTFGRRELVGILDAAHATDLKTRRSVTGLFILFAGAAIAYKSRLQSLVATSSTEAEFYAAVFCAKLALYFRYILQDLDALAPGPTVLYIDNQAALHMINEKRPTDRARHVDTQWFAIQQWRELQQIVMKHLPGVINAADALTKAVTATLLYRHCRRAMGHYFTAFSDDDSELHAPTSAEQENIEAGEGVRAGKARTPSEGPSGSSDVQAGRRVEQEK